MTGSETVHTVSASRWNARISRVGASSALSVTTPRTVSASPPAEKCPPAPVRTTAPICGGGLGAVEFGAQGLGGDGQDVAPVRAVHGDHAHRAVVVSRHFAHTRSSGYALSSGEPEPSAVSSSVSCRNRCGAVASSVAVSSK